MKINIKNILLLLLSSFITVTFFGYSLLNRNPNRLFILCLTFFLTQAVAIGQLQSTASFEFRVLIVLWLCTLTAFLVGLICRLCSKRVNLTFFFWLIVLVYTSLSFLILLEPVYLGLKISPLAVKFFAFFVRVLIIIHPDIEFTHFHLQMSLAVMTFVFIISAFVLVLLIEMLTIYVIKKMKGGK
jgi:hypothetical protein